MCRLLLLQLDDFVQQQGELKQQRLQLGAAALVAATGQQQQQQEQQQLSQAMDAAQVSRGGGLRMILV
jgi:hypothetical protein